jgi:hypothetical protein
MGRCKRRHAGKDANSTLVRSVRPRLETADVCPGFLCSTSFSEAPSRLARWVARLVEFLENKLACSPLALQVFEGLDNLTRPRGCVWCCSWVAMTVEFVRCMVCCSRCGIVQFGESDCLKSWSTVSGEPPLYAMGNPALVPYMQTSTGEWHTCQTCNACLPAVVLSHATFLTADHQR